MLPIWYELQMDGSNRGILHTNMRTGKPGGKCRLGPFALACSMSQWRSTQAPTSLGLVPANGIVAHSPEDLSWGMLTMNQPQDARVVVVRRNADPFEQQE